MISFDIPVLLIGMIKSFSKKYSGEYVDENVITEEELEELESKLNSTDNT